MKYLFAAALSVSLLFLALNAPSGPRIERGAKAPTFALSDTAGNFVSLKDAVARNPLLLIFWSGTCPACKGEMTVWKSWAKSLKAQKLQVYGVLVDRSESEAKKFQAESGFPFPSLLDTSQKMAKSFAVASTPTMFLVDQKGIIQARYDGGGPQMNKAILADAMTLSKTGKLTKPAARPSRGAMG